MRTFNEMKVQVGSLDAKGLCDLARMHGTDATNFYYAVKEAYEEHRKEMDNLMKEITERQNARAINRFLTGEDLREYNSERHDPDSVFFDDSYTGPSERELSGGCNVCGGVDDCYCDG